jgi:hypothetical protein
MACDPVMSLTSTTCLSPTSDRTIPNKLFNVTPGLENAGWIARMAVDVAVRTARQVSDENKRTATCRKERTRTSCTVLGVSTCYLINRSRKGPTWCRDRFEPKLVIRPIRSGRNIWAES